MRRLVVAAAVAACSPLDGRPPRDAAADGVDDLAAPDDVATPDDAAWSTVTPRCPSGGPLAFDRRYQLQLPTIVAAVHPWFNAEPLGAFYDAQGRPIVYGGCANCIDNTGGRAALWRLPENFLSVERTWGTNRAGRAFDGTAAEHARYWLTGSADDMGRLVVGGYQARGGDTQGVLARFLSTGLVDASFGVEGRVVVDAARVPGGASRFVPFAQHVDARGLLFVGADTALTEGSPARALALRLTDAGALDASFGDGGFFRDDALRGCFDVRPDGDRYVLACRAASGRPALYVLGADGRPATSALREHTHAPDDFRPSVLERDGAGRWIVVGSLSALDTDRHGVPALARFLPDGTPDVTYGARGLAQLPGAHRAWRLALRASARLSCQDRMLVGVEVARRPAIAVFRDDGALDGDVGSGGLLLLNEPDGEDPSPRVYAILTPRPAGEVVALPWYNARSFHAARITP